MSVPYWRLSGFYFCYLATLGALVPFWSLYLKHNGFSAEQVGELTAMLVATKIVAPHLWGWLADKTGRRLVLIRIAGLLSLLTFAGFLYRHDYQWVAWVTLVFSLFWNAILPQFEAATLQHLIGEPQRYSRIRLWGSIGFIAAVLGVGRFLDHFNVGYLPIIIASLLALNWLVAMVTPEAKTSTLHKIDGSVWRLVFKPELLAFFCVYMLLQVAHGPYYAFYSVYLQQHGYTATQTGLMWALGVVAEIAVFIWLYSLLKYFSLRALLLSSLLLSSVRWIIVAHAIDDLWWVLTAQLLHAASFGVAHVVAIQLLHRYFGAGHQSKGQAFYSSTSFGLGGMLGTYFSGYCWDSLGGNGVFLIAAWVCGLALLIAFIGVARESRPRLG